MSLADALNDETKKALIVADACALIDDEVKERSGISGLAIKAGYGAVKGVKPGFIAQVVGDLLPAFASALGPLCAEAKAKTESVASFFSSNPGRVADALLAITDARAERAKSGVAKSAYDKLRGSAKKHVEQAAPRLGRLIEKHSI